LRKITCYDQEFISKSCVLKPTTAAPPGERQHRGAGAQLAMVILDWTNSSK